MGGNDRNLFSIKSTPAGAEVLLNGNIAYLIGQEVNLILEAQDMDASRLNISPKVRETRGHPWNASLWLLVRISNDPASQ